MQASLKAVTDVYNFNIEPMFLHYFKTSDFAYLPIKEKILADRFLDSVWMQVVRDIKPRTLNGTYSLRWEVAGDILQDISPITKKVTDLIPVSFQIFQ